MKEMLLQQDIQIYFNVIGFLKQLQRIDLFQLFKKKQKTEGVWTE